MFLSLSLPFFYPQVRIKIKLKKKSVSTMKSKMPQIHKVRFCVYFQRTVLPEDRSYFLHFTVEIKTQKSNSPNEFYFENYI